jgi:hypothetical protein
LPKPGHPSHEKKRRGDESDSGKNHKPSADPINQGTGQKSKRKSNKKKTEKEPLSDLSSAEAERFDEGRIEKWKAVINNADSEKEIQKGGDNNPPAIKDALRWIVCHVKSHVS